MFKRPTGIQQVCLTPELGFLRFEFAGFRLDVGPGSVLVLAAVWYKLRFHHLSIIWAKEGRRGKAKMGWLGSVSAAVSPVLRQTSYSWEEEKRTLS